LDDPDWAQVFGGPPYVFGDSSASWIHVLPVNGDRSALTSTTPVQFASYTDSAPVSFRTGPDRALYVVMHRLGRVYRFAPAASGAWSVPSMSPVFLGLLLVALAVLGMERVSRIRRP
jgi:hypothetical protein